MNEQVRVLLREAAERKGVTVQKLLSDVGKEFPESATLVAVANHVAGQEYEQQQRELLL